VTPELELHENPEICWIDEFLEYTSNLPTPRIFRKWAAIATIAGALERRIWLRSRGNLILYPNMYTVLVAHPGVGKSILCNIVRELWASCPDLHIAPSNVSRASLIDSLYDAKRTGEPSYNALAIASSELGVLLSSWENEFMSALVDIYDCNPFTERKRGNNLRISIPRPCLNLLACATPSWLQSSMPHGAWDQGFASRTLFIYSNEIVRTELFPNDRQDIKRLSAGIATFSNRSGEFHFHPRAEAALRAWYEHDLPPIPEHPKLRHYNSRRITHFVKLCLVCAAARRAHPIIELSDFQLAQDLMLEAEAAMSTVFDELAVTADSEVMDDIWFWVTARFRASGVPIPSGMLYEYVRQRTPAHNVKKIIDLMVAAGLLNSRLDRTNQILYTPIER
jgi:hypothetical protein